MPLLKMWKINKELRSDGVREKQSAITKKNN